MRGRGKLLLLLLLLFKLVCSVAAVSQSVSVYCLLQNFTVVNWHVKRKEEQEYSVPTYTHYYTTNLQPFPVKSSPTKIITITSDSSDLSQCERGEYLSCILTYVHTYIHPLSTLQKYRDTFCQTLKTIRQTIIINTYILYMYQVQLVNSLAML